MTMCSCDKSREFYRFPSMAKLDEFARTQQMIYISGETKEAESALFELMILLKDYSKNQGKQADRIDKARSDYGIELMDIIHAAETALRMEFSEEEVAQLRDAVEEKNRERGYYG